MSTETWTSVEKLYARTRNNIFKKKRIPNIQILDFESFIFWSKFRFLGDCFQGWIQLSQLGVDLIQKISC